MLVLASLLLWCTQRVWKSRSSSCELPGSYCTNNNELSNNQLSNLPILRGSDVHSACFGGIFTANNQRPKSSGARRPQPIEARRCGRWTERTVWRFGFEIGCG